MNEADRTDFPIDRTKNFVKEFLYKHVIKIIFLKNGLILIKFHKRKKILKIHGIHDVVKS